MLVFLSLPVGGVVLATTIRSCEAPMVSAPDIAWDGARYTVAWDGAARSGRAVYIQQFAGDDGASAPRGAPIAVYHNPELRPGASIVKVGDGFVALARHKSLYAERSWESDIVAIPLDHDGRPAGEPTSYEMLDVLCAGPVEMRGLVLAAFRRFGRSHHHPDDLLGVLALDSAGHFRGWWFIASSVVACATAIRDDRLAVAWIRHKRDSGGAEVLVSLESIREGSEDAWFRLPVTDASMRTVQIVAYGDGLAVLYQDTASRGHVVTVDVRGGLRARYALPAEVDVETVDLGANARGLFVTWIARGTVHVLGVGMQTVQAVRCPIWSCCSGIAPGYRTRSDRSFCPGRSGLRIKADAILSPDVEEQAVLRLLGAIPGLQVIQDPRFSSGTQASSGLDPPGTTTTASAVQPRKVDRRAML